MFPFICGILKNEHIKQIQTNRHRINKWLPKEQGWGKGKGLGEVDEGD